MNFDVLEPERLMQSQWNIFCGKTLHNSAFLQMNSLRLAERRIDAAVFGQLSPSSTRFLIQVAANTNRSLVCGIATNPEL
ncbi:MAG: hypothetical protein M2R45_02990 [Verrucomicrobia subdivision 3 bacterium]|nr:hypothetical protein [Limisphaerales bacterium]MCS1416524.1 hypothetical protein [Limisphaerales bacterium]